MYVSVGLYTINIVMQETQKEISRLMKEAEKKQNSSDKQAGSHDLQGKALTCYFNNTHRNYTV